MNEIEREIEEVPDPEAEPATELSEADKKSVTERGAGSAKVVHEVVRLRGHEELDRPLMSLLFSGFAAGVAISTSLLAQAFLSLYLPDEGAAELVVLLGYSTGFVLVILGSLQLFTESTVTAMIPLVTHRSLHNLARLARLWVVVFTANLAGTLLVAALIAGEVIVGPEQRAAAIAVSHHILGHAPVKTLLLAIPAGFLVASISWTLPNARGSEFWVILMVTYVIALGGFAHVVAGSAEAWLLMFAGVTDFSGAVAGFILPALLGNIIGGSGLFAVVAHAQVHNEIAIAPSDAH